MSKSEIRPTLPWWRVRMVWMVLGLPAAVVVASFITLALAVGGADAPLLEGKAASAPKADALTPATQARNHAVAAHR